MLRERWKQKSPKSLRLHARIFFGARLFYNSNNSSKSRERRLTGLSQLSLHWIQMYNNSKITSNTDRISVAL